MSHHDMSSGLPPPPWGATDLAASGDDPGGGGGCGASSVGGASSHFLDLESDLDSTFKVRWLEREAARRARHV